MNMKDRIAQIISDRYQYGNASLANTADEIIDALPDMIEPLVWPAFSSEQVYQQAAPLLYRDTYALRGTNNTGWNAYYGRQMLSPMFSCHLQAQAAAQTHHVTQIMAAFGVVA